MADAISCHTAAAAYAVGEERRRGCLLPGLEADLVVLDTDIVAHPERIAERPGGRDHAGRPLGARAAALVNRSACTRSSPSANRHLTTGA